MNEVKVTILEASSQILSAFDAKLVQRAVKSIKRAGRYFAHFSSSLKPGVHIRTDSIVKEVTADSVILQDGEVIKCGMSDHH